MPERKGYAIASSAFRTIHRELQDRNLYSAEQAESMAHALENAVGDSAMRSSLGVLAAARNTDIENILKEKSIQDLTHAPDLEDVIRNMEVQNIDTLMTLKNSDYFNQYASERNKQAHKNKLNILSENTESSTKITED